MTEAVGPVRPVAISVAEALQQVGKSWRIRLTYDGANPNNKSGVSHKAWEAWRSATGAVMFGFGPAHKRITNWARISSEEAFRRAHSKVSKGYIQVTDTPLAAAAADAFDDDFVADAFDEPVGVPTPAPLVGPFADSDAAFARRWRKQA